MMRPDCMADMDGGVPQTIIKLPEIEHRPMRRSNAPIPLDFSDVRSNLRYHGRDILNVMTPYRARGAESLVTVSFEWAAVIFGVFACGAIHTMEPNSEEEGKNYVRTSCGIINVWRDNLNLDRARAALLASIFLYSPRPSPRQMSVPDRDRDEETISYVSGDMQGTSDGS
ncbi:hypothetical protein E8E15_000872 [Penicillium rubens]|nr:hypothetical protein E8E15_000872 [Penicillium rubens]